MHGTIHSSPCFRWHEPEPPTGELFERCAPQVRSEVELVPGAWDRFRAGDTEGYLDAIARHADDGGRRGFTTIALAQASMAPAAERCRNVRPLTSPGIGVRAARAAARTG